MSKNSSLTFAHNASLRQATTLHTAATAKQLFQLKNLNQLPLLADAIKKNNSKFIILGEGSNVLFADDYDGLVIINSLTGTHVIDDSDSHMSIHVSAGEKWHDVVVNATQHNTHGLENLALIPGTMGAAPVQNIGAYGVEIADFIESVSAFDLVTKQSLQIPHAECGFGYRNSHFKRASWKQKYLITGVTLSLSKKFAPVLSYAGLCKPHPPRSGTELLNRVVAIRKSKLPDPNELANAGSFFKNPIIERTKLQELQSTYRTIPYFDVDDERVKIPAAWLIEMAGFKGYHRDNDAGVYDKHALILVNHGDAHGRDIYELACDIIRAVAEKFTITISPEVHIVGI